MNNEYLIGAQELASHRQDRDWRVVDCRFDLANSAAGGRAYLDGHIPGAVFADLNKDLAAVPTAMSGRHPLPAVADISKVFSRFGIDADVRVVVYDAGSGAFAARTWWLLRWLGHERVALLDGGFRNWTSLGLPLRGGHERVGRRQFEADVRHNLVISTAELVARQADIEAMKLVDARDEARFRGESEPIDAIAGHIPGATNLPFSASLRDNGAWRGTKELAELWSGHLGADKAVEWSVMCGSGVTACHLALSGMLAGFREPSLYAGSWSEWIRDPERPIALGKA